MVYILSGNPVEVERVLREQRVRVARGVIKLTPIDTTLSSLKAAVNDLEKAKNTEPAPVDDDKVVPPVDDKEKTPEVDTKSVDVDGDSKEVPPIDNMEVSPEVDTKTVDVDGDSKEVKADDCKDVQAVDDKKTAKTESTKSKANTKK